MSAGGRRSRWIPLSLAAAAFALSFAQRTGLDTADTKIDLHVDPVRFLHQLLSVWSPTEGLGHVQGGQYSGYLWPMGPFFALGHLLGVSDWIVERLWLGTLLALAAWGAVRLLDVLGVDRRRGVAQLVAGAVYMVNPYVVVISARATVFLLAYAALPWLMVIAHRGLRTPRRWWAAAAFALVVTSSGGGVNATVTAFVLLGPVGLTVYEWLALREVSGRAVWAIAWRTVLVTALASAWWIVPLLVQSGYGLNFLAFTEQVGAIWATTSLSESLRLMGYWPSYLGQGYGAHLIPYYGDSGTLLFNPVVVVCSLLVPGLALAGYAWTRRWRYGPFLLCMALVALLLMSVGWPSGTAARAGATFVYNHVTALQFLRTTYKAGPLEALAVAGLAGGAARALWAWVAAVDRRGTARVAMLAALGALIALGSLPLLQGRALELTFKRVPAAWTQAGARLDATLPRNSRAVVLPGQEFAYYDWGATIDPILTATTGRPVAIRNVPPYADLHAVDFLWTLDDLVAQQRLLPGQLRPLLDLISARRVVTGTDDDDALSGALSPAAAARTLDGQAGLGRPAASFGPSRSFASVANTADPPVRLPQVRIYDTRARGLVRVEPAGPATVIDGSAQGIADAAALHQLPRSQPLFYAGDESAATLRAQALAGADILITDSNRRRVFVASRSRANVGATTPADQPFSPDAALLDPFPARGAAAQTVAAYRGARYVTAPYNPEIAQFPASAPYAAFDGDPRTSWLADPTLAPSSHWVQIGFDAPRNVPYVDILPDASDPLVAVTAVQIAGRTFAVHPGWNHLVLGLRRIAALRITIAHVRTRGAAAGGAGGLAEVRIPGVRVTELLRPPVLAEQALRGVDSRHASLSYLFERTTADSPLARGPEPAQTAIRGSRLQAESQLISVAQDAETQIGRAIDPPSARRWTLSGLATVSPHAPDPRLDALAGTATGGAAFTSSGRLQGLPGHRASAAFDGSTRTAWVAPFGPHQPAWIAWHTRGPRTLRRLRLVASSLPARFPTRLSIAVAGRPPIAVAVSPGGVVSLPTGLRAASFRLTVLAATGSPRAAVAIAEIRGAEVPSVRARSRGSVVGVCGQEWALLGGLHVALRLGGSIGALNAGEPLSLVECGRAVALPAGPADVTVRGGVTLPLLVSLRSPAPDPLARTAGASGEVLDPGDQGSGSYTRVRVRVSAPSWLVLGESYDRGWQASCDGRSLGPPRVIDAFANGWPVRPGCREVAIRFGPQSEVNAGYIVGAIACLLALAVVLLARPRPPWREDEQHGGLAPPARYFSLEPARALAVGVVAGLVFAFLFALRAGAVLGPVTALILWRGLPIRALLLAAGGLLVIVVPAIYLLFPGLDQGGYDFGYAAQHLGAHWITVAAFALLALVVARDLVAMRGPPAPAVTPFEKV
ncbi:MAG: alpha-(1-_3)-arabinofuranosyltransferase domain-containing protein [Solirubrobacteraceae bacterium]